MLGGEDIPYKDEIANFAFWEHADRLKGRQFGTRIFMLQRNMTKYRDIRRPKIAILPNPKAAFERFAWRRKIVSYSRAIKQ